MEKNNINYIICAILLILLGVLFPIIFESAWFNIIFKVREAISAGDSGHLILASASMSILYAVQSTSLFLGGVLIIYNTKLKSLLGKFEILVVAFLAIILLHVLGYCIFQMPWEPISTILSLIIALLIFQKLFGEKNSFVQVSIVAIQVFFAFQWINIMPIFSPYLIGQSDLPFSIKIASIYLQSGSVLNFTGFAFFMPFIFSAFITATLFVSYTKNINMMRENYAKESEIQAMKSKILENRISKEVKSLVHDLKTPLVTIRGLNSLLTMTRDNAKLNEYTERIDNSVGKMTEMISSFLYETERHRLNAMDLIDYIRAQLPLEDDSIKIHIKISEGLPDIYVNKIRVARAVINILENAIIVPCKECCKNISFEVRPVHGGLHIVVEDNGIGIKEEDISKIFELGYSTNRTSGLGLPFAKQIIEDNLGRTDVKSKPCEGTVVTIFLPSIQNVLESNYA